jgi:hypothetical protein
VRLIAPIVGARRERRNGEATLKFGRRTWPATYDRGVTDPRAIPLSASAPVSHDSGVHDREADVGGTRWALVEYAPSAGRADWCDTPHSGYVLSGSISYAFEDEREPLVVGAGEGFVLPATPRHRGTNRGSEAARLFIIDALPAPG